MTQHDTLDCRLSMAYQQCLDSHRQDTELHTCRCRPCMSPCHVPSRLRGLRVLQLLGHQRALGQVGIHQVYHHHTGTVGACRCVGLCMCVTPWLYVGSVGHASASWHGDTCLGTRTVGGFMWSRVPLGNAACLCDAPCTTGPMHHPPYAPYMQEVHPKALLVASAPSVDATCMPCTTHAPPAPWTTCPMRHPPHAHSGTSYHACRTPVHHPPNARRAWTPRR